MDKLFEFQKFCNECDDEDMVKEKSKELFVLSDIKNAKVADLDLLNQYDNIIEFAEEVEPMLNCVSGANCSDSSCICP